MKKRLSIIVALVMALTIFCIPGQSAFADDEEGVQAKGAGDQYTVEFDSKGGPAVESQTKTADENGKYKATDPGSPGDWEDATYTYTFDTWCSDPELTEPFDFNTELETGITLYARWNKTEKPQQVGSIKLTTPDCTKTTIKLRWTVTPNIDKVVVTFDGKKYTTTDTSITISGLKESTVHKYSIESFYKDKAGNSYLNQSVRTDGPYMSGGYEYYSLDNSPAKNKTISFTDTRFGTNKYNLNHYYDASGKFVGRRAYMYNKIKNQTSKKYLICIDRTNNVMCVYIGGKGKWRPYKYWSCVTGRMKKGNYHPTPLGTYKIKSRKRTFSGYGDEKKKINKYSVWYCSRFKGSVFIHSQLYKYKSKSKFIPGGGAMGSNKSHGCVRLFKDYSYWIYKNCAKGTKVIVIQ